MLADGGKIVGEFQADNLAGQGDADFWRFPFERELKLVVGTITWPDGRKYVGEFYDGNCDGNGIEIANLTAW